jgi:FAD/FMN-containing dehydrogenase
VNLVAALRARLGEVAVLSDATDLAPFLVDWRGRYRGDALALVQPASTDEVAAAVTLCAEAGASIVAQGGNTGLCGGATPAVGGRSVILSLRRMNRVLAVDRDNNTMTVEAGCLLADAQAAAHAADRLFALSLAAEGSCTIGGNIATNAGGVHVVRYGTMRDLVLGLEAVLPDGRVFDGLRGLRKDNTGYDLKQLFIGSEGTLGVVTRAVLKLHPLPTRRAVAWLGLASPAAAVGVLGELQSAFGPRLAAFELLSRPVLDVLFRQFPEARDPLPGMAWAALVEFEDVGVGAGPAGEPLVAAVESRLNALVEAGRLDDAVIAQTHTQAERLWWLREHVPEAEKREGVAIKHDIALPVSSVPDFVESAGAALQQAFPGCEVLAFGHLGDGNLHYNVRHGDPAHNPALLLQQDAVNRIVYDHVKARGGSISAEHGIGQLKRDLLPDYKSAVEIQLMQRIRAAVDPQGIMNPGKLTGPR